MKKKKMLKLTFFITLIVVLIFSLPYIVWRAEPERPLEVLIVDKTVPDTSYREHSGFMWILNNMKIVKPGTNARFSYDEDYYGFFPLPNEEYVVRDLPAEVVKPDIIYLTDTYGVYQDEFYESIDSGDRSQIIYGGLDANEIEIIKNNLDNATIIGEFNTMASPTGSSERNEMEEIYGLRWSGWIGRYFPDLSKSNQEIPTWMKENYAMQYGELWNLSGSGIVLVDSSDSIIVLKKGVEIGDDLNRIAFTDIGEKEFKVKNNVNYYYWFDICEAMPEAEVLASYQLDLTEKGHELFRSNNLPSTFPAVTRKTGRYTSYYFSGDFADIGSTPKIYSSHIIPMLNRISTFDEDTNQDYFYWNVYYPLVKGIIENVK